MDHIVLFLKEDILSEDKTEAEKIRRKAPRFWLSENQNYTSALFLGRIYFVFTLRHQSRSLRNYMKGFVEATQEADLYLIEPSLRAIGGQICRKKRKNM